MQCIWVEDRKYLRKLSVACRIANAMVIKAATVISENPEFLKNKIKNHNCDEFEISKSGIEKKVLENKLQDRKVFS